MLIVIVYIDCMFLSFLWVLMTGNSKGVHTSEQKYIRLYAFPENGSSPEVSFPDQQSLVIKNSLAYADRWFELLRPAGSFFASKANKFERKLQVKRQGILTPCIFGLL